MNRMNEADLYGRFESENDDKPDPLVIGGETFEDCGLFTGYAAHFSLIASELERTGYSGNDVLVADLFPSLHWLYGDFQPLKDVSPWSYGTNAGIEK